MKRKTSNKPHLVSCIMPTRSRPLLAAQAIYYFLSQDYPERELIVVYEKPDDLPHPLPADERIRCLRYPTGTPIGSKRNYAVTNSRGSIIAQWDDDDWYSADRLSRQAEPLINGEADITGLAHTLFFDLHAWRFWACSPVLFARMFAESVLGGSLVYRKAIWQKWATYPDTSLAEDAWFLRQAVQSGARLIRLDGRDFYIYLRHNHNSWGIKPGNHLEPQQWRQMDEPPILAPNRCFYLELRQMREGSDNRPVSPALPAVSVTSETPLVSCIMPTADRHEFSRTAIAHFMKQDYPNRELIVVDDGLKPVKELMPPGEQYVRYIRLESKLPLGTKRNLACQAARGAVIVHWDDDDWMAPGWLSCQVEHLNQSRADIGGLNRVFFYDMNNHRGWQYVYPVSERPWVCGGTLCYSKDFWLKHPFADMDVGEDCAFVWQPGSHRVIPHHHNDGYVGFIHDGNTSPKLTGDRCWHPFPAAALLALMKSESDVNSRFNLRTG